MLIRSLALAALVAVAGPVLAADSDSPLAQEQGKARPLIIIARSSVDPTLVHLKDALKEPANQQAFAQRNLVLYTVVNTIGQRDGKNMDPQATMALIRGLSLGAGELPKTILVGKDGTKKLEKSGPVELKEIFDTVDAMPMAAMNATPILRESNAPHAVARTHRRTPGHWPENRQSPIAGFSTCR
ncbi:DUF4174 domain-containing protein [Pseudomonas putida]